MTGMTEKNIRFLSVLLNYNVSYEDYILAGQGVKNDSVFIQFNSWNRCACITDFVFHEKVVFVSHLNGGSCVSETTGESW